MISDMRTHRDTIAVITTAVRLVVTSALASMLPSVWTTGLSAEVEAKKEHIKCQFNKSRHVDYTHTHTHTHTH